MMKGEFIVAMAGTLVCRQLQIDKYNRKIFWQIHLSIVIIVRRPLE
jgi:hypothetical protein